jgi:hypothetical protein
MTPQDATPKFDFILIPREILSLQIPLTSKAILSIIWSFTKNDLQCFVTDQQFSDSLGESLKTIKRHIAELKKQELVHSRVTRINQKKSIRCLEVGSKWPYLIEKTAEGRVRMTLRWGQNDPQYINNNNIYNNTIEGQNDPTLLNQEENMPTFQDALEAMIESGFLVRISRANEEPIFEINTEFDSDEAFRLDQKQGDGRTLMLEPELFLTFEMKQRFNRWKAKSPVYFKTNAEDWDSYVSEIVNDVYRWSHRNGITKKNWYLECLTFIRRNPMSAKAKLEQPAWARASKLATALIHAFTEGNRTAIQQLIKENNQIAIALQHWTETYKIPKGQIKIHLAGLDTAGVLALEKKLSTLIENELQETK